MILDALFLIFLILFGIRGYSKGIVVALFSVLAILLGALGALKLSGTVADMLFDGGSKGGRWAPLLAYSIVFLLIVLLVRAGARLLQRSFEAVSLGWINRLSGALLYAFLLSFVFSSMLWLCNQMGLIQPETQASSHTYAYLEPVAPKVFSLIGTVIPFAKHIFEDLSVFFDRVNQSIPPHVGSD